MKRLFLPLLLLPALCIGAPFDLLIQQRNIGDSATATRVMPIPAPNVSSIFGIDQITNLPALYRLSPTMGIINGELSFSSLWGDILNKPTFSTVSFSGDYNDLINKPSSAAQVNSDWTASSGVAEILNKPSLATVAASGAYSDLSGAPTIPAAQVNSDWAAASGLTQVLNKPTTLAGYGVTDAYPLSGNPSGFLTAITGGQVTSALGFTPYNATNPSAFITQAGARSAIALTTTGSSGAATYNSATGALNVPSYAASRTQAAVTRSLNAAFQVSATRDAQVQYSVQMTITASITGGQDGDVFLDIASDSGFTTNVQSVDVTPCSQTYTLAIALQGVQKCAGTVRGYVPAGYYARIRTVNNTGTPGFAYRLGQEVLQ